MHFQIRHTTSYRYSHPVVLGPHTIRLRPQNVPGVRVSRWSLQIQPAPAGSGDVLDAAGNLVHTAWFNGETTSLTIVSSFEAHVPSQDPYHFIVTDPGALDLPVRYADRGLLAPYLASRPRTGPVPRLAAKLARQAGGSAIAFARLVAEYLSSFDKVIREEGPPESSARTLASRRGACRDLAVLFIELCRCQGLAARFVSGYWRGTRPSERRYLHAWTEVYLPGAGWRGFDPSSGLAIAGDHIPVAAAPDPEGAAPVTGAYAGGPHVEARMDWHLRIHVRL